MGKVASRWVWWLSGVCLSLAILNSGPAHAQDQKVQTLALVREAMDAYSNLDFDTARSTLEGALALSKEIDAATLARVYVSYGVLEISGFADNAKGQRNFITALCLDETIMVDPLLSSPEIDIVFAMAKQQATPEQCQQLLANIEFLKEEEPPEEIIDDPPPPPPPTVPPCGQHSPPTAQKAKHELPLYLELSPEMRGQASRLVLKYQFDGGGPFMELAMDPLGAGYGVQISCDEGQIRIFDPIAIGYFIEGFDRMGNLVCAHGSMQAPIVVVVDDEVPALSGLPGMAPPRECAPCPPWEPDCSLPGLGDPCDREKGCKEKLVCSDEGICDEESVEPSQGGPQKFYVSVGGGIGFGYMKKDMTFDKISDSGDKTTIETVTDSPAGFAWGGIPTRLWAGYFVIPNLAIEVGGRFDVKVDTFSEPVSCWEGAGRDMKKVEGANCTDSPDSIQEAKESVALTNSNKPVLRREMRMAWLVNARARYQLINKGAFRFSAFGGLGFGYIKYRVTARGEPYFPMPWGLDIEVGAGIAYYFTDHFGLVFDIPIDFIVINGFALNFDAILGLSFGF